MSAQQGAMAEEHVGVSVAKVVEISSESPESFDAAIEAGITRASETLDGIKGAWVKEQSLVVEDGRITVYRVNLKVTFVLNHRGEGP